VFEDVERAEHIIVRALDRNGRKFEVDAEGLAAVCIQHEMDHLEGKLFVDYLSEMKRERIRKKLDKDRKERAAGAPAKSGGARRAY
jgi:peptide deformylase